MILLVNIPHIMYLFDQCTDRLAWDFVISITSSPHTHRQSYYGENKTLVRIISSDIKKYYRHGQTMVVL